MSTHKQEMRILSALLTNLRAAGFAPVAVWIDDGYLVAQGDTLSEVTVVADTAERSLTDAEVRSVFEDYDLYAPTVHFTHANLLTWGNRGVMVVPGNGGDFISDFHVTHDGFSAIVDEVSRAAYAGAFE